MAAVVSTTQFASVPCYQFARVLSLPDFRARHVVCLPEQSTTHRDLMFSRQTMRIRHLPQRIVTTTFALVLLCAGLCVLPGYASSRDFHLADFKTSCRVTGSLQGADLELSLVRSENGHVMTRKLVPSGLFSLFLV